MYVYRYIKDTNIKNSAQDLNTCITKLAPDVMTWTPKPGSVLDLGVALRDPTNRLNDHLKLCVCFFPCLTMEKETDCFLSQDITTR